MALNLLTKPGPGAGVHRVSRGGSSLCPSPGDCEAGREGTGTLRSPEDSGSAPARLCRHGRAAPPASLLPHLHRAGGDSTGARRGSAPPDPQPGAQPGTGSGSARCGAAPAPCRVPDRAGSSHASPVGHGPHGPSQGGGQRWEGGHEAFTIPGWLFI